MWLARRVARQLGRSDCVVRRCWDQWIREMSFTRRPSSGHPRQTSCDESVRNLSTNLLRRLFGEYKFAFISNQLQKNERDMQNR
ncbi:uncharacterized protein TNCV_3611521 [Trichonephila clavipes]|nr:uncharacterized protein TNCV_3611521 [Trichonephila clavipes]